MTLEVDGWMQDEIASLLRKKDVEVQSKKRGYAVWWHSLLATLAQAFFWVARKFSRRDLRWSNYGNVLSSGSKKYIYLPQEEVDLSDLGTYMLVCHELAHIYQEDRMGTLKYRLKYLFFPLPIFNTGRARLEYEAYTMGLVAFKRVAGQMPPRKLLDQYKGYFTSADYVWMEPPGEEKRVMQNLERLYEAVDSSRIAGYDPKGKANQFEFNKLIE